MDMISKKEWDLVALVGSEVVGVSERENGEGGFFCKERGGST